MCIFCSPQTNTQTYNALFARYIKTIRLTQSLLSTPQKANSAIKIAQSVDHFRFAKSPEWADPNIASTVKQYIFANPNPDEGLLLFTLCCWLSIQAKYRVVWTTYLTTFARWLSNSNNQPFPRSNFSLAANPVRKALQLYKNQGSIGAWFLQTVQSIIANQNARTIGNIYRFAARVCQDLYGLKNDKIIQTLTDGNRPADFTGGHYKRIWMYIMFLRRDNYAIKCLLTRALQHHCQGKAVLQYWYDPNFFDPAECELPVDIRVQTAWKRFGQYFHPNFIPNPQKLPKTSTVANLARKIANSYSLSPSLFDAILFA